MRKTAYTFSRRAPGRPVRWGLGAAGAVFALDQASKAWALAEPALRPQGGGVRLTPFLDLVLTFNKGVSYSMFSADSAAGRAALLAFSLAAVALLGFLMARETGALAGAGYGLMIGGALGNALDRVVHGAVVDFAYFHTSLPVGPLANYVFNLADVGLTFGVILLIYDQIFGKRNVNGPDGGRPQIAENDL